MAFLGVSTDSLGEVAPPNPANTAISETFEAKLDGGRFVGAPAGFDFVVL